MLNAEWRVGLSVLAGVVWIGICAGHAGAQQPVGGPGRWPAQAADTAAAFVVEQEQPGLSAPRSTPASAPAIGAPCTLWARALGGALGGALVGWSLDLLATVLSGGVRDGSRRFLLIGSGAAGGALVGSLRPCDPPRRRPSAPRAVVQNPAQPAAQPVLHRAG